MQCVFWNFFQNLHIMWAAHKKKHPEAEIPEEFMAGSELVLNTNEELVPMNRMHGENTVSLMGCGWEGGIYGVE